MTQKCEESVTDEPRAKGWPSKPPEGKGIIPTYIALANAKLSDTLRPPDRVFTSDVRAAALRKQQTPDLERIKAATGETSNWHLRADECRKIAATMPAVVRDFLGRPEDVLGFCRNYVVLWQARELLPRIAAVPWSLVEKPSTAETFEEYKLARDLQRGMTVIGSGAIEIILGTNCTIELVENPVLTALAGVRADCIRTCPICGDIFWAPRKKSEGCKIHGAAVRMRRKRSPAAREAKAAKQRSRRASNKLRARIKARSEMIDRAKDDHKTVFDLPESQRAEALLAWFSYLSDQGFTEEEIASLGDRSDISSLLTEEGFRLIRKKLEGLKSVSS